MTVESAEGTPPPAPAAAVTATSIPEGQSLFDVARRPLTPTRSWTPTTPTTPTPRGWRPRRPAADPATILDADDDRGAAPEPAPPAAGETHQPRTDADIDATGSLFDL
ncbi:MAG: hypothetical protein R2734_11205 [Nocardioides sp.]